MSPLRTGYVPRLGSQQGSSQRDESQTDQTMDQTEPSSQCPGPNKRGRKRARGEKSRSVLKVKLPNLRCSTLSKTATDEDKTMGRTEPNANVSTDSNSAGGSVFFFFQRPSSKATNEKDKAKLSVLRTISKMLEENQLIRQRLAALSQAN